MLTFSISQGSEYAILANINGNKTALTAVLKDISARNITNIIVLGNICGIGARNNDCVDIIKNIKNIKCIAGYWDSYFIGNTQIMTGDDDIKWFLNWSKELINDDNIQWLKKLKIKLTIDNWMGVSGRFDNESQFEYVHRVSDARKSFDGLYSGYSKLGFVGCTGVPVAFFDTNPITFSQDGKYKIDNNIGTIINVGSVGSPKDENPDARYVIFSNKTVNTISVKYDVESEILVMSIFGFPKSFQEKLRNGK